ncbi:MAG: hypothetical protein AABZ60_19620, partial [Planctomycetota bacterium]
FFLIGFILFSGMNTEVKIRLEGDKTISSKVPANFPLFVTIFLMVLSATAGASLLYYVSDLSKKLSLSRNQQTTVRMLEGDLKKMYLFILEKQECLQKDLVYELGMPKVKVTRLLDKLDEKGLVKRLSYGKTNKIVAQ